MSPHCDAADRVARECHALCRRLGAGDERLLPALALLLRKELAAEVLTGLLQAGAGQAGASLADTGQAACEHGRQGGPRGLAAAASSACGVRRA